MHRPLIRATLFGVWPRALGHCNEQERSVTVSVRSPDFQRSFVAMRYFWGARGPVLAEALDGVGLLPAAAEVLAGLSREQRAERAQTLGVELGRLATALDERGLWR